MNAKTLRALKSSIKHWEENVAAKHPTIASVSYMKCALCRLFVMQAPLRNCGGCPVKERTRRLNCFRTPYYDAAVALDHWRWVPESTESRNAWRKAARAELKFLKSLLPKGKKK